MSTIAQADIMEKNTDTISPYIEVYGDRDLKLVKGKGSYLWDDKGRKYLDCVSGVAVNALGHGNEQITRAIQEQLERYIHVSNLYLSGPQMELARLLTEATHCKKVFFCNSGTEANEGAIKFARKYWSENGSPERFQIISFEKSFHGRTYGALAATGQEKMKQGFGPMPEGFLAVPLNDNAALAGAVNEKTAAVIFEPILAEGGILDLSDATIRSLKGLQEKGILLICDEIQTGIGRTGLFLACEAVGLKPDIVTLAKALGGGLPLGAVLVKEAVAAQIGKGAHGSTFGGNPLACAAGTAVIRQVTAPGFLEDVRERSGYFRRSLELWVGKHPDAGFSLPLLGAGFLAGLRYAGSLDLFIRSCREAGLLVYRAGTDVLRFLPPLNISREEIEEAVEKLDKTLVQLS